MQIKTIKKDEIISNGFMKIRSAIYEHKGKEIEREYWDKGNCVAVVAISDNGNIFLTKQPRIGINKIDSVEIPAGYCREKHSNIPFNAAKAELKEETGCDPEQCEWYYLGYFIPDPDKMRSKVYLYLAMHAKVVFEQNLDEGELVEYFSLPFDEAVKIMEDQNDERLKDAPSIIALTRVANFLKNYNTKD